MAPSSARAAGPSRSTCAATARATSRTIPAAYGRADLAGDIVALMDHLELGRVDLLGYSMGAHLALGRGAAPSRSASTNLILGGVGEPG